MTDLALLPETTAQTQTALLAFVGIVGGGLVAYEIGQSVREGDLFKTDAVPPNPEAGAVALVAGLAMFGVTVNEAVKQVGWKPLVLGSLGIAGVAVVARAIRG